ncbi:type II toxin-antitoxin system VapC family toxin [Bradyrhizobium sp.]|uniref:type II toxin-antitoxin system VapC family toxin n=1 Tax=Bradyrhizobium sp. TaxID=376 RepID=UPI003C74D163
MTEASSSFIYLDTNVFIKAVEGLDEAAAPAKTLIRTLRRQRAGMAATSEITFAEVLAPSKQAGALPLHTKRRAYLDLLLWSGFVALIPVSRNILIETAALRATGNLKLPDAIQLASAILCRFFVSADKDFNRMPEGMERLKCDHDDLTRLLKELS